MPARIFRARGGTDYEDNLFQATALLLFLILGRRWMLLPGLIAEAIPGMGAFPVWVLVVLSIIAYDDIKGRKH
jgi:hypothetical protein